MGIKEILAVIVSIFLLIVGFKIIGVTFKIVGSILSFPFKLLFGTSPDTSSRDADISSKNEKDKLKQRIHELEQKLTDTSSKSNGYSESQTKEKIIYVNEAGSNTYVDRSGFGHPKYCNNCTKFVANSSKHKGLTYCTAHQVTSLEEPFKTYYNSNQPNYCPNCYPRSAD